MLKRVRILAVLLVLALTIPFSAFAHSGRTDSSGGHRDNKNKSGLGSYHYHCGGHPPHLHSNGVCPYSSSSGSSGSGSSSRSSTTPKPTKKPTPTPQPTLRPFYNALPLTSNGAKITSYYGHSKNVVIPDALDDRTVVEIGQDVLAEDVEKVTIPATVSAIDLGFSDNPDVTIVGTPGSFAHQFAIENGYDFEVFLPDEIPLSIGSKGNVVEQIQQSLIDLGYLADVADGKFGRKTKAAVEAFQADRLLSVTGIVDAKTYSSLLLDAFAN